MPHDLHHRLSRNVALESKALAVFLEELSTHLRATSGEHRGEPGFVTFIQHFGSTLNLHVHFHVLALDGVYQRNAEGALRFWPARTPTQEEIEALVERAAVRIRAVAGRVAPEDAPKVIAPMLRLLGADMVDQPPAKHLTAESDGFNLHAATSFRPGEAEADKTFKPPNTRAVPRHGRCFGIVKSPFGNALDAPLPPGRSGWAVRS